MIDMAWEINEQRAGYTVWAGRDVNGRRVWAVTTNRDGTAVEPTSQGLASKKVALQVYHEDRAQLGTADECSVCSTAKTQAEQIADRFGNDGQRWTDDNDLHMTDALNELCAYHESDLSNAVRYAFADGSAIVESGGCWDVEGSTPFSWEGAE